VSKYKGIIKDEKLQMEAVKKVKDYLNFLGIVKVLDITKSKIKGQDGNQEYFIWGKVR
jgi:predicted rRNA methylase YqxC with S4 and FtsJ domains